MLRKDDLMKRVKALGVLCIHAHKAVHPLRRHQNALKSRCGNGAPFSEADGRELDADVRLKSGRSLRLKESGRVGGICVSLHAR